MNTRCESNSQEPPADIYPNTTLLYRFTLHQYYNANDLRLRDQSWRCTFSKRREENRFIPPLLL